MRVACSHSYRGSDSLCTRRVGFPQTDVELDVQIPSTVEHLLNSCDIIEKGPVAPPWDFVWSAITEEGREKQMFSQALVVNDERLFSSSTYDEDRFYVADATVKASPLEGIEVPNNSQV